MEGEFNVCSSSALRGIANSGLCLKNENTNEVTVDEGPTHPDIWPFLYPDPPFTIDAKAGSEPGIQGVVLNDAAGTYHYATTGCPNSPRLDTNPKTVIIS